MTTQFGTYSQYYDLLYQDKDYRGETGYVQVLLSRFVPSCSNVLELGCGTGRHAELLADAGLHVTGVEFSDTMLEQANERVRSTAARAPMGSFTAIPGDARVVRVDQRFSAVISLFHVVSYQTSNQDVKQMFETAALHLNQGGCFVFDVWYGPAVVSMLPTVRIKRMENSEISVIRLAEPAIDLNRNQVEVNYTVFVTDKATGTVEQFGEQHHMRYYFAPELELLAEMHGLQIIHSEEWMTAAKPSEHTWGVTFVAQKC
jgi:SAM-dependent methyltransferase